MPRFKAKGEIEALFYSGKNGEEVAKWINYNSPLVKAEACKDYIRIRVGGTSWGIDQRKWVAIDPRGVLVAYEIKEFHKRFECLNCFDLECLDCKEPG